MHPGGLGTLQDGLVLAVETWVGQIDADVDELHGATSGCAAKALGSAENTNNAKNFKKLSRSFAVNCHGPTAHYGVKYSIAALCRRPDDAITLAFFLCVGLLCAGPAHARLPGPQQAVPAAKVRDLAQIRESRVLRVLVNQSRNSSGEVKGPAGGHRIPSADRLRALPQRACP
ncbi:hypothetical protein NWF32_20230 [Pseudomonas qingdaonensis]|nr:hypothetical protein [Pseudomonas qingdaonensis]